MKRWAIGDIAARLARDEVRRAQRKVEHLRGALARERERCRALEAELRASREETTTHERATETAGMAGELEASAGPTE